MNSYRLTIVTPKGKIFEDEVESLVAPGIDGQLGVLAHHGHMVTQLTKGVLIIKSSNGEYCFAIDSGVLEVNEARDVVVLADNTLDAISYEDGKEKLSHFEELLA